MTETISISLSDKLAEALAEELEYGDNRSAIVREALREHLDVEDGEERHKRRPSAR